MRRVKVEPRPNAIRLVQSQGLVYNVLNDPIPGEKKREHYWNDDRYYAFTLEETELLDRAATDVFNMLCEASEHLTENPEEITSRLGIPAYCIKQIIESWDREPAFGSVYSRFDICFGGLNHPDPRLRVPKFYEINADTPVSLLESSAIQWFWLEQTGHGPDQHNSIDECLIEAWKRNLVEIEARLGQKPKVIHFASSWDPWGEDRFNAFVLGDTCHAAGYKTKNILIEDIGLGPDGRFYDADGLHIDVIFKMYPWDYMMKEEFGKACFADMDNVNGTIWFEAPYKLMWSSKAIFAVLWDMFKDDPRGQWLLPTYLESEKPASMTRYARKPFFSFEGRGVTLYEGEQVVSHIDPFDHDGGEGWVVQELALLPEFKDDDTGEMFHPLIGLWMIDGDPAGFGIREDLGLVTQSDSCFVPHVVEDAKEVTYVRKPVPTLEEIEASLSVETYDSGLPLENEKSKDLFAYINSVVSCEQALEGIKLV
ncbi:hypothetical protein PspLS_07045 [Pyricularia sp. CBS 133598]|nr:hypothetical protein PspLS_07045 [Pyricularia sp. CBS 133598]